MTDQEPLAHVRRPDLPWRTSRMTECGRPTADVKKFIDRAEALELIAKHGKQRAAFLLCMMCLTTCKQYPAWEDDPTRALQREFFGRADPALDDELRALGALVAAHRDEFDDFMTGINDTIDLAARRRQQRRQVHRRADGRPR